MIRTEIQLMLIRGTEPKTTSTPSISVQLIQGTLMELVLNNPIPNFIFEQECCCFFYVSRSEISCFSPTQVWWLPPGHMSHRTRLPLNDALRIAERDAKLTIREMAWADSNNYYLVKCKCNICVGSPSSKRSPQMCKKHLNDFGRHPYYRGRTQVNLLPFLTALHFNFTVRRSYCFLLSCHFFVLPIRFLLPPLPSGYHTVCH